ncbi:MAG TPA: transcriptional regulator [Flavobacteriaceae bacterium]|nr:transcriptional regulator [Flavobacteriaceae bacterium]
MVNSADFAKRLGEILDYYGITAAAFSDMLEVNRSTISHLLSGRNKPSLEFVLKVLNAFPEVELYWLLNGQGHFPTLPKINTEVQAKNSSESKAFSTKETEDSTQNEFPILQNKSSAQKTDDTEFSSIERIVVFYQNGKFKTYSP